MQKSSSASSRSDQTARAVVLGLLCALPALMCFRVADAGVADADLGWHLRAGEWILAHHAFPHTDPFSRLGAAPWQAYSWLFELIVLKCYVWFNLEGFVVFTAAMLALIGAAVYHLLSRLQSDFSKCALLATAAMICMSRGFTPRPWLFTILLFTLELDILMQARRTGRSRELLWLPPMFALWANVHIQFVDGLLMLGIAAVEPLAARWWRSETAGVPARSLWLTLLACVGATLVNPYGVGIYKIAWQLSSQAGVLESVSEMSAMPFRSPADFLLLFLALGAAGVLSRRRHFPPFETLLLAVAAVISFRSQRDMWFLTIIAISILAAGLPGRRESRSGISLRGWSLAVSALAAVVILFAGARVLHVNNARFHSRLAKIMPVDAVEVVKSRHYAGPLFNTYAWGGFLIWNLRQPVSIDGRAALYGDVRIDRSRSTWDGGPEWASDPDLSSAGIVIAPDDAPLTQLLRTDGRFELAYHDQVASVFVARKSQSNAGRNLAALEGNSGVSVPGKQLQ